MSDVLAEVLIQWARTLGAIRSRSLLQVRMVVTTVLDFPLIPEMLDRFHHYFVRVEVDYLPWRLLHEVANQGTRSLQE